MQDNEVLVTDKGTRSPKRKRGKLMGAKPPLRANHAWSIIRSCRPRGENGTSRSSILRSTANGHIVEAAHWFGCQTLAIEHDTMPSPALLSDTGKCELSAK